MVVLVTAEMLARCIIAPPSPLAALDVVLSFAVIVVIVGMVGVSVFGMVTEDVCASVITTVDGIGENHFITIIFHLTMQTF